jgi:hypothetical protein
MNDDYGRNVANDDQVREWAKTLRAERALADGLYAALLTLNGRHEALARYREARGE